MRFPSLRSIRLSSLGLGLAVTLLGLGACNSAPAQSNKKCDGGRAGGYACHGLDLAAYVPIDQLTTGRVNDAWGYRHDESGRQFALVGTSTGTVFVEVTNPIAPVVLGTLPTHGFWIFGESSWRDIKVFEDHAFIVSEAADHGMQVFDLRLLLNVDLTGGPVMFEETAHYAGDDFAEGGDVDVAGASFHQPLVRAPSVAGELSSSHNISINESSGFAYLVGTDTCAGGLHMVDVNDPTTPTFVGCFDEVGYIHDVECVIYSGADLTYVGREICVAFNGEIDQRRNHLAIVDVTDKAAPELLSRVEYPGSSYAHQGAFDPTQSFVVMGDELDEVEFDSNTRTLVWDVRDLDDPTFAGVYEHASRSSDHNMYFARGLLFQANYTAGVRVLAPTNLADAEFEEVAYFDTYSPNDDAGFFGAWTVFPFLDNVLIVTSIDEGLFVLLPQTEAP